MHGKQLSVALSFLLCGRSGSFTLQHAVAVTTAVLCLTGVSIVSASPVKLAPALRQGIDRVRRGNQEEPERRVRRQGRRGPCSVRRRRLTGHCQVSVTAMRIKGPRVPDEPEVFTGASPGSANIESFSETSTHLAQMFAQPTETTITTTMTIPTLCCEFPPGPDYPGLIPACLDAFANHAEQKCFYLGSAIVSGAVCDPNSERCVQGEVSPSGVCCQCPVPSPPFPNSQFCFETILDDVQAKCLPPCVVAAGARCDPLTEMCR